MLICRGGDVKAVWQWWPETHGHQPIGVDPVTDDWYEQAIDDP